MAQVEVKKHRSVSAKSIEKKIEIKVDEPAAVLESKAPKTNEERKEENSSAALEILSEPPAESEAKDAEPVVTKPIITASPTTPLVIVTKAPDGKREVTINPTPEAPVADAPVARRSVTASGKKADEPGIVAEPAPAADPEVKAAKSVTATADADIKKIERSVAKAEESSSNVDEAGAAQEKKQEVVVKVVKKVEKVAQEAVKDLEKLLKETELAVEKAKPLLPNKCFYIESMGPDGKGSNLFM